MSESTSVLFDFGDKEKELGTSGSRQWDPGHYIIGDLSFTLLWAWLQLKERAKGKTWF